MNESIGKRWSGMSRNVVFAGAGVIVLALGGVALYLMNSARWSIQAKNDFLCRFSQLDDLKVFLLPTDIAPEHYVRKEDLDASTDTPALFVGLIPAAKALGEARAEKSSCEVIDIRPEGAKMVATVRASYPAVKKESFQLLGELGALDKQADRIRKAGEMLGELERPITRTIDFVQGPNGWVANYGIPEAQLAAARRAERVIELTSTIAQAKVDQTWEQGLDAAEQLLVLDADNKLAKEAREGFNRNILNRIEGKWIKYREVDKMTDDTTTAALLSANEREEEFGKPKRYQMVLACAKTDLYFGISSPDMLDKNFLGSERFLLRVDDASAETIKGNVSDDFKQILADYSTMKVHLLDRKRAILRLHLIGSKEITVSFDLAGIAKAFQLVEDACK